MANRLAAAFVAVAFAAGVQHGEAQQRVLIACDPIRVSFAPGSSELTGNYLQIVRQFVLLARQLGASRVTVIGFSDETEGVSVAQRRTEVVRSELVGLGVDANIISTDSQSSNRTGGREKMWIPCDELPVYGSKAEPH